jgi:molecular chaperone DnaK (HSP70)
VVFKKVYQFRQADTFEAMAAFSGNEKKLVLGEVSPDCKPVIVGLDFGTAYSGIAIAYRADPGTIISCAPSTTDAVQTKVPTTLLRLEDGTWEFGYDAEAKYSEKLNAVGPGENPVHLFKRFKMVLKGQNSGFEALTAPSIAGAHHSLMDLISVSLRKLKEHAMARVKIGFGQDLDPATDVQWVLTVPAIWNDFGKAFMRKAAFKAGLMDTELSDNLILVLEPEGAALAVHVGATAFSLLDVGSRFMVLDCGGGTVDITVHEVMKVSPLKMKAIAIPCGGEWGGDYVNLEFKKFLAELLGEDLYKEAEFPFEFYKVYCEFDRVKMMFDPTKDPTSFRLSDVLENKKQMVELAKKYNLNHPDKPILDSAVLKNGFLPMSKALMLSFFEPLLAATVKETRSVLTRTGGITTIMVVGGFGSSKAVTERIRSEFHGVNGIRVIMPDPTPKPQGAIVQGAVYFGLHKNIIDSRLSPYTYGIAMQINGVSDSFFVLVTKGQELPEDHFVEQVGQPGSAAQTALKWRIFRSDLTDPKTVKGEHLLGHVLAQCPPNPNNALRAQKGRFMFGGPEIKVTIENASKQVFKAEIKST